MKLRNREGCVYNGKESNNCYLFVRKFDDSCIDMLIYFVGRIMGF